MDYIRHTDAVDKMYRNLDWLLQNKKIEGKKIVIFGSSKVSSMIAYYLFQKQRSVYAIIDNSKERQHKKIYGLQVYAPEEILKGNTDEYIILIASGHQREMVQQLEKMDFYLDEQVFIVFDFLKELEDYSFVDRRGYKEMTTEDLRKEQLYVLKHLKQICTKHNIRYYLAYGTLLGAVRHHGYIPWDDDIDVYVYEEDISKLCEILKDDQDCALISCVNGDDYYDEYHLMISKHSILDTNHFPIQLSTGVSIDIFPLSAIPVEKDAFEEYCTRIKELEMEKWNHFFSKEECLEKAVALHDFMIKRPISESDQVGCILSFAYTRDVYPKEWFEPIEMEFEGELFSVPKGYDGILSRLYGNYMTPPPVEQQVGHHFFRAYYKNI